MEWVELLFSFVEKQTGHLVVLVSAFAWPVVALFLLGTQKKPIGALIDRIKSVEFPGGKLDAQLEVNTAVIEQAKEAAEGEVNVQLGDIRADIQAAVAQPEADAEPPAIEADADVEPEAPIEPEPAATAISGTSMHPPRIVHGDMFRKFTGYVSMKPSVIIERAWWEVEQLLPRVFLANGASISYSVDSNEMLRQIRTQKWLEPSLLTALFGLQSIRNEVSTKIMGWEPARHEADQFVINAEEVIQLLIAYLPERFRP